MTLTEFNAAFEAYYPDLVRFAERRFGQDGRDYTHDTYVLLMDREAWPNVKVKLFDVFGSWLTKCLQHAAYDRAAADVVRDFYHERMTEEPMFFDSAHDLVEMSERDSIVRKAV